MVKIEGSLYLQVGFYNPGLVIPTPLDLLKDCTQVEFLAADFLTMELMLTLLTWRRAETVSEPNRHT